MHCRSHDNSKIAKVARLCDALNLKKIIKKKELAAIKLHFGEYGNDTHLNPTLVRQVVDMIGLVFYNALLRYIFSSSYPPSEEWARFLFMYITFFGAIEAFICKKHIAVDLLVVKFEGAKRKTLDIMASACSLFALGLLFYGGVVNVLQTLDTYSVATNVNMAFINGTLPVMALVGVIVELRSLAGLVRRPASTFHQG